MIENTCHFPIFGDNIKKKGHYPFKNQTKKTK